MRKYNHIIVLAALFALVFSLFGKTLNHRFNSDDYLVLYQAMNHSGQTAAGGTAEFLQPSWGLYYRPVIKLVFDFLAGLFGLWPGGYHLVSLLCYAVLCCQIYWLGSRLTDHWIAALGAAAIFMTSTAHSEAIFWISSLNGVVENLLVLSSLICFVRWRQGSHRLLYPLSIALFVVALFTKESAIALPLVLIGYDSLLGGDARWPDSAKRATRSCWPFVAVGVLFVILRSAVMRQANLPPSLTSFNWGTLVVGLWYSLIMTLSPVDWAMALNWFDRLVTAGTAFYVLGVAVILAILIIPLFLRRFKVTFLLWWVLAGAAPVLALGLVPSERHIVLASAGAALLISVALFRLADWAARQSGKFGIALGCVLVVMFVATSLYFLKQREAVWKNSSDLANSLVEQTMGAYPAPERNTTFFFLNVPDTLDGALVFRFVNLAYALRLYYREPSIEAVRVVTPEKVPDDALSSFQSAYFKIGAMGGHIYLPARALQNDSLAARWDRLDRLGVLRKDAQYLDEWARYEGSPFLIYERGLLKPSSSDELKAVLANLYSLT